MMYKSRYRKYDLFIKHCCISASTSILDVGVADKEFSPYDNFLEKHHPYSTRITALSVEKSNNFKLNYPKVHLVNYPGGLFPFSDKTFDVVHSNAVIEHVGNFDAQVQFVSEIARVGSRFFITTPSRRFPVETHTNTLLFHYLPKNYFDFYLRSVGKVWATGNYMNLVDKDDLKQILERAGIKKYHIITEKLFLLPLHYIVVGEK